MKPVTATRWRWGFGIFICVLGFLAAPRAEAQLAWFVREAASDGSPKCSRAAVAAFSPAAELVGPREIYRIAQAYVAGHPGADFVAGSGDSMLPLYKDHTVLITERIPPSLLRAGMTVVFVGASGFPVAHVLVRRTPLGWLAMGLANEACDAVRVREDNYLGVVVKALEPTSSPLLALIAGAPSALAPVLAANR
jgi:hypothetical protein